MKKVSKTTRASANRKTKTFRLSSDKIESLKYLAEMLSMSETQVVEACLPPSKYGAQMIADWFPEAREGVTLEQFIWSAFEHWLRQYMLSDGKHCADAQMPPVGKPLEFFDLVANLAMAWRRALRGELGYSVIEHQGKQYFICDASFAKAHEMQKEMGDQIMGTILLKDENRGSEETTDQE